ncbi:MAG: hypothetical protein ACPHRO_13710, partial [Nannocystaceae bacterium]
MSRFDFRRVPPVPMVEHLRDILSREEMSIEDEGIRMVARLSDGSVRDALTYLDKVISFSADPSKISTEEVRVILGQVDRFAITELLDAVLASDATTTLTRFEAIASTASDLMHVAVLILQHLRDLAVVQATQDGGDARATLLNVSAAIRTQLLEQAQRQTPTRIAQLFDRFTTVVERAAQSSAPRLVIEMGLLELVHATPMRPLGELVDRLQALENGAGQSRRSGAPAATPTPPRRDEGRQRSSAPRTPDARTHPQPRRDRSDVHGLPTDAARPPRPSNTSAPAAPAPPDAEAHDPNNPYWKILGMEPGQSSGAPASPIDGAAPPPITAPASAPASTSGEFQLDGDPQHHAPRGDG